ncbi:hypothetical protein F5B18DRAFT_216687 [Nemania serpens]|nr:hypothetical protein F5B18DRAFT_216687 [Nemania serpens]
MGWPGYLQGALFTLLASIMAFMEPGIDLGSGGCIIMCLIEEALLLRVRSGRFILTTVACIIFEERGATYSIQTCDIPTQPRQWRDRLIDAWARMENHTSLYKRCRSVTWKT